MSEKKTDFLKSTADLQRERINKLESLVCLLAKREIDFGAKFVKYWFSEKRCDFAMVTGIVQHKKQMPNRTVVDFTGVNLIAFSSMYGTGTYAVAGAAPFVHNPLLPDDEQKKEGKFEPWYSVHETEMMRDLLNEIDPHHEAKNEADPVDATTAA